MFGDNYLIESVDEIKQVNNNNRQQIPSAVKSFIQKEVYFFCQCKYLMNKTNVNVLAFLENVGNYWFLYYE